jgi:hypothetical protein
MTRFSLCCAVHYIAALRRGLSSEDALAVGYVFAKYYAILKNSRHKNTSQQQNHKPKFVPVRATILSQSDFPVLEFGKVIVKAELCYDARKIFEFYAKLRNQLQL